MESSILLLTVGSHMQDVKATLLPVCLPIVGICKCTTFEHSCSVELSWLMEFGTVTLFLTVSPSFKAT